MGKVYVGLGVVFVYVGILAFAGKVESAKPREYASGRIAPSQITKHSVPELQSQLKAGLNWLHFYRQECPCSRASTVHVEALRRQYPEVNLLAINVDDQPGAPRDSFLGIAVEAEQVWDADQRIAKAYGIHSTPSAVLVDGQGKALWRGSYREVRNHPGFTAEDALLALAGGQSVEPGELGDGCLIP